jgi:hypothetical protein
MRNLIYSFLALTLFVGIAGCGDSGNGDVKLPDLSMKPNPDLSQPLTGCSGYLDCIIECNQGTPSQACYDDCEAAATQTAVDLFNAYLNCIDTECFQATNLDSGMPYCDPNSDDPFAAKPCSDCNSRVQGTGGACRDEGLACDADKP